MAKSTDAAPIVTIRVRFRSALGPAEVADVEAVVADVTPDGGEANLSLKLVAGTSDVVTGSAVVNLTGVTR